MVEVERIAALADPVVRNLQITQCYCELSRALAARTGGGPANWCTFATWASKQAGQTIREEDLARAFERLFAESPQATGAHSAAAASMTDLGADGGRDGDGGPDGVRDAVWRALLPTSAFDRASDAVARGNLRVFAEIGPAFARLLALPTAGGTIDPAAFGAFHDNLRPGEPPNGQAYLRQAFTAYAAALGASDPKRRAELMLLANVAIGLHEQTRLQPQITEAMNAAFEEPVKLRRELVRDLLSQGIGSAVRLVLELVPGRATTVKTVLDDLDAEVKLIAREAITELLMTLALPGEVLRLARDVPGAFPADLTTIEDPDLRALLTQIDPTPDTTRDSGAENWSDLSQRLHYIADLFRVYQERSTLLGDPFTPDQVAVIKSGGRPAGRL